MAAAARSRSRAPTGPPVQSDVYVGLLVLALLAQIAGAVFLFLDWSQYPEAKAPKVQPAAKSGPPPAQPGPGEQPKDQPPKQ
jgi:hypothetical protein